MTFVPPLADAYGRKWVFCLTLVVSIIAQFGLLVATSVTALYVLIFLLGTTFAGRIVVGLAYTIEFLTPKWHANIIYGLLLTQCVSIVLFTAWYQFVDRSWITLHAILLAMAAGSLAYFIVVVPESPKWLYTW